MPPTNEQISSSADCYKLAKDWLIFWASHKIAQEIAPDPLATVETYMVSDLGANEQVAIIDTRMAQRNVEPKFIGGQTVTSIMHRNWCLANIASLSLDQKQKLTEEGIQYVRNHRLQSIQSLTSIKDVAARPRVHEAKQSVSHLAKLVKFFVSSNSL